MTKTLSPKCTYCDNPAAYVAAQSMDQGKTVTWMFVCPPHVDGWNDGGDWNAPVLTLARHKGWNKRAA